MNTISILVCISTWDYNNLADITLVSNDFTNGSSDYTYVIEKGMICKEVNKALNKLEKFKTSYVHQGAFFFTIFHSLTLNGESFGIGGFEFLWLILMVILVKSFFNICFIFQNVVQYNCFRNNMKN